MGGALLFAKGRVQKALRRLFCLAAVAHPATSDECLIVLVAGYRAAKLLHGNTLA